MPTDLLDSLIASMGLNINNFNISIFIDFILNLCMLLVNAGIIFRITETFFQMQQEGDNGGIFVKRLKNYIVFIIMVNVLYFGLYKTIIAYYFNINL